MAEILIQLLFDPVARFPNVGIRTIWRGIRSMYLKSYSHRFSCKSIMFTRFSLFGVATRTPKSFILMDRVFFLTLNSLFDSTLNPFPIKFKNSFSEDSWELSYPFKAFDPHPSWESGLEELSISVKTSWTLCSFYSFCSPFLVEKLLKA